MTASSTDDQVHPLCLLCFFFLIFCFSPACISSQKSCPDCGSMKVPYPLSTDPSCGDPEYKLRCNRSEGKGKLYLDALNHSSYVVLTIDAPRRQLVVQPSPWVPGVACVTQDLGQSEGLWLNQTLPFNVTNSNTVFLFNCSPRLLISPLNCTASSLCHRYLDTSGRVAPERAEQCGGGGITPCCTFVAGGLPSAYKIRLHNSGCRAFRSVLHLDPQKPAREWKEGLEIQWSPAREPGCRTQSDCSDPASTCSSSSVNNHNIKQYLVEGVSGRCLCNRGYYWDDSLTTCTSTTGRHHSSSSPLARIDLKITLSVIASVMLLGGAAVLLISRYYSSVSGGTILMMMRRTTSTTARAREEKLRERTGGKPGTKLFTLKEVKRATNGFSEDRKLGSGGFGEVYRGVLPDGTRVAVKSAKLGNVKSTEQVLNEVGILSQVNHKNLVKLLGCCIEGEQPLMIYEYVPNGDLHRHIHHHHHGLLFLDWETRLKIALQTAEALAYLHSSAHTPIFHRDVKSTNILLDEKLEAKVADFGLSKLAEPGLSHVTTCAQGTLGYLDPEYYKNYQLTDKSDVYSYGIVLLELLTSKKAIDFSREQDDVNLAMYVMQTLEKGGGVTDLVDPLLVVAGGRYPEDVLTNSLGLVLELSLSCLREKKGERPSMKDAVRQLQSIVASLSSSSRD